MPALPLRDGVTHLLPGDRSRALKVWEASTRATHHFVSEKDIVTFRRSVRYRLSNPRQIYTVRDSNEEVVGFVALDAEKVELLFVHPEYRAMGIGKRLMRYAVDDLGATRVDVNEQNEQALGFYLHLGFAVAGRSERDGTGRPYPILHLKLSQKDTA